MTRTTYRGPFLLALGTSLRAARTARGLGLRRMADKLGISPQALSLWETGKRWPTIEDVAHFLGFLRVDAAEYRRIMWLRRQLDNPTFVETAGTDPTSLQRIFEQLAVRTFEWASHVVPEQLQTPEYLHAILQGRAIRPDDIDQAIFVHQVQQIDRHRSGRHTILLDAAALEPTVESQLHAIRASADLPNLKVRIVPENSCGAATIEPFTIYETEGKVFTVMVRHHDNVIFLSEPETVQRYRSTFKALAGKALRHRGEESP